MSGKSKSALPASTLETFEKVKRNAANQMESTMYNAAEQFEKASARFMAQFEQASDYNTANLNAAVEAANVVAGGVKELNQLWCAQLQNAFQHAFSTGRAMLGVKSLQELTALQNDYVKDTLDNLMAETTKLSEVAVRCSSEAAEPIKARITQTVEQVSATVRKAA